MSRAFDSWRSRWRVVGLAGGLLLGLILAEPARAQATVPPDVSYQGLLWLADGSVGADGVYDLEFSVWDTAQGGSASLWSQLHSGVVVRHGVFDVVLSDPDGSLATALEGGTRYLETLIVTGGGLDGTALAPRQRIGAAAWALVAEHAAEATSRSTAPPPGAPAVPSGLVILWAESTQCPPGFELMDGVQAAAGTPLDLRGRYPMGGTAGSVDPLLPDVAQTGGFERHGHSGKTEINTSSGDPHSGSGVRFSGHTHKHFFDLDEALVLPDYATVLFCRKL